MPPWFLPKFIVIFTGIIIIKLHGIAQKNLPKKGFKLNSHSLSQKNYMINIYKKYKFCLDILDPDKTYNKKKNK